MTVAPFPEPCWVAVTPYVSFEPHHATRDEATAELADGSVVYLRPDLCWFVTCDGCGVVRPSFDDEGYEYTHHNLLADAEDALRELGPLCDDCDQAAALGSVATATGGVHAMAR
jgi:hypothetical protein